MSNKKFKTFAFSKAGSNQLKNETEGIGIGLSTAECLARSLGGKLLINTASSLRGIEIEVEFSVAVTSIQNVTSFSQEIAQFKSII